MMPCPPRLTVAADAYFDVERVAVCRLGLHAVQAKALRITLAVIFLLHGCAGAFDPEGYQARRPVSPMRPSRVAAVLAQHPRHLVNERRPDSGLVSSVVDSGDDLDLPVREGDAEIDGVPSNMSVASSTPPGCLTLSMAAAISSRASWTSSCQPIDTA